MGKKQAKIGLLILCLLLTVVPSVVFGSSENWIEVTRFTHEGENYPTELFTIDYIEWRIMWEFEPGHWHFVDLYSLNVTTYREGESANHFNQIIEPPNGNLKGVELLNQSGTFYLKINPGLIDSYTIIIEQNTNSAPESEVNWVELTRFSGSHFTFGLTESFQIYHEDWRILWETNNLLPEIEHFDFCVFREEDIVEIGHYDINKSIGTIRTTANENGTLNIQGYTGLFYIWISPSPAQWELIVEQNIDSIPEFPSWTILSLVLVITLFSAVIKRKLHNAKVS